MNAKEKIEAILVHLDLKAPTFASNIGVKYTKIFDIQREKTKKISGDVANAIIIKYPEFNLSWILSGKGSMLNTDTDTIKSENQSIPSDSNFMLVPLYSHDVVGGINNQESDTNGYVTGYMPFVNAKQGDICVPVTNNSMVPTYPPGTIVQIRRLDYWKEFVEFGKVHIIELMDERRLIKVIRKGKDDSHFTLVSHNKEYDDAEISIKFIQAVWLVLSKYEKVVM